jgi:hypothetical protein
MGTRNLTRVIDEKGVTKVAQYGQWDGYPSGQGVTALNHLRNSIGEIHTGLRRVRWITNEELAQTLSDANPETVDFIYPNLVRHTGADILGVVAFSIGEVALEDFRDFEDDTLFCEGIYTVNFQENTFTTNYHGVVFSFPLNELPTQEDYLARYEHEVKLTKVSV